MKKKTGALTMAAGLALGLWSVTAPAWGLGVLIALALFVGGFALYTTPKLPAVLEPKTHVYRWLVEAVVPMAPTLTPTLKEMLEDEVVGLRLQADEENFEVRVFFKVEASGRDVAERIGERVFQRQGLVLDGIRATRP